MAAIVMAGAEVLSEVGVPQLPVLTQFLDCLPGKVSAIIVDSDVETRQLGKMSPLPPDMPVDLLPGEAKDDGFDEMARRLSWEERREQTPLKQGMFPESQLSLQDAGMYRGHRLMALQLFPVQVDAATGMARIIKRARVRVTMPHGLNSDAARMPDRPNETQLVRDMLGPLASTALPSRMTEAFEGRGAPDRPQLDDPPIGGRWKLAVNLEGIVRVGHEQLVLAGVPVDAITTFDTHIYHRGQEVPIYFEGEGDGHFDVVDHIDFYGLPNRQTFQHLNPVMYADPWTDDNIYWLSWGDGQPGMRLGQQITQWHPDWPTTDIKTITQVRGKLHLERDLKHDRLAQSAYQYQSQYEVYGPLGVHEDHWFYGNKIDGLTTRDFSVTIPFPNTRSFNTVKVRAALQGFSYAAGGGNEGYHRATVYLNGITAPGLTVGKVSLNDNNIPWRNQSPIIIETTSETEGITTDQLVDGTNIFSVTLPGDGLSGANDKIYVNWFEVEYDREMRASKGGIGFDLSSIVRIDTTIGDTLSIDLRGFSSPSIEIWDRIGNVRLTGYDVRYVTPADESPSWAARFRLIVDRDYNFFAFDTRPPTAPVAIAAEVSTRDLRAEAGAEYLLIYHDSFELDNTALAALARLDSMRQASFSFSTMMIPVHEIYEQFNGGIINPYAIRDFLQYAYDHWEVRPTHVCLVGDGVMDIKGYHGTGNMIPSLYVQTMGYAIGICASDMFFGCVSGPPWDIVPDLAVGRISARTGLELQTYVDKVLHYETVSDYNSFFHGNMLFVADKRDVQFNFVRNFSEPAIREIPNDIIVSRVYLDSLASGVGPNTLRDAFRSGALVVNYNGHGGGGVWSNANLMTVSGVRQLRNRRGFPFITNFTCFVGAYDDRDQTAVLGEAFMFSRNNDGDLVGGIGVYSSSGVGWANAGAAMQRVLFDFISVPPAKTLGEIVNLNKIRFWALSTVLQPRLTLGVQQAVPYSQTVMMNLLGDPGVKLRLPFGPLTAVSADTAIVGTRDTLNIVCTLPWTPGASPSDLYLLPFNGDEIRRTVFYDTTDGDSSVILQFLSSRVPMIDPLTVEPIPVVNQTDTFQLVINERFRTPYGRVIVYATDRTFRRDALSSLPIYWDSLLVDVQVLSVTTLPVEYILNDSAFQIQARIMHLNGIERARMRGVFRPAQGPVVLDTLELVQLESGLWQSDWLGPYHTLGATYQVTFQVLPFGEDWVTTSAHQLPLEQYTDLYPDTIRGFTPGMYATDRPNVLLPVAHGRIGRNRAIPEFTLQIHGVSDSTAPGDTTVFVVDSFTTDATIAIPDIVSLLSEALLPVTLKPRPYQFTLRIDPYNEIVELNEANNTFVLNVDMPRMYSASSAFGSYYLRPFQLNAYHRHWQGTDSLWLRLAPGSLPMESAAIVYSGPDTITATERARLREQGLTSPLVTRPIRVFHVQRGDSGEALTPTAEVEVWMNISNVTSALIAQLGIYHRRSESANWQRIENIQFDTLSVIPNPTRYTGRLRGTARGLGHFVLLRDSADGTGPAVEITVDGMSFTSGSILPRRPLIYANLTDVNGVDRGPGRFYLILDNDTIPESEISWSDTLFSGGNMSALIRPQLEPGHHILRVHATDNVGDASEIQEEFEVRGEFGIEWAINYPNPFQKTTSISYLLTDVTDQFVEVRIYTVSGRKIKTLRESDQTVVSYRSILWDGTDETGEEVANGVYFARLKAKQGDHEVEKTIKMAKIR